MRLKRMDENMEQDGFDPDGLVHKGKWIQEGLKMFCNINMVQYENKIKCQNEYEANLTFSASSHF